MIYSKHAKDRMAQYNMTEAEVEATVTNYETRVPAKHECVNCWKTFGSYRLRVTLNPSAMVAVTVWKEDA